MRTNKLIGFGLEVATPVTKLPQGAVCDVLESCPVDLRKLAPAELALEALQEQVTICLEQMGISMDNAVALEAIAPEVLPVHVYEYTAHPSPRHYNVSLENIFTAIGKGIKKVWEMICNFFRWLFRLDRKGPAAATQKAVEKNDKKYTEVKKEEKKAISNPPAPTKVNPPKATSSAPAAAASNVPVAYQDEKAAWGRIQTILQNDHWYIEDQDKEKIDQAGVDRLYDCVVNNAVHFKTPDGKACVTALQNALEEIKASVGYLHDKDKDGFGVWATFEASVRFYVDHYIEITGALSRCWATTGSGLDLILQNSAFDSSRDSITRAIEGVRDELTGVWRKYENLRMMTPNNVYTGATEEFGSFLGRRADATKVITDRIKENDLDKKQKAVEARLDASKREALDLADKMARNQGSNEALRMAQRRLNKEQEALTKMMEAMTGLLKLERDLMSLINVSSVTFDVICDIFSARTVINTCRMAYLS